MTILVGADPEFFLRDKKTKKIVSAHDLVPGTKNDPFPLKGGGFIQADGTAVEFNIAPSKSPIEFAKNIAGALADVKGMIDTQKFEFAFSPSVVYEKDYFDSLPNSAKELGCEPDFDAYKFGTANPRPNNLTTMRTGSGHLHIGFTDKVDPKSEEHMADCILVSMAMDIVTNTFKGLWDNDTARQRMYGKPGCFRPKSYGVEYRTLSNAWLNHPKMWPWLFTSCEKAIHLLEKHNEFFVNKVDTHFRTTKNRSLSYNIECEEDSKYMPGTHSIVIMKVGQSLPYNV
jgi:hypothetical protein